MKPFLRYLTEDSKSTIDNNSKLLEKKLKAHGVDLPPGSPGSVHDWFNSVMGTAPEHHKLWIAKRYVSGGIAHTEDIAGTLNLLQRHDQLLAQGNISSGTLPKLKTNAELYSFINKNDPDKDMTVGNQKVNSELVKPNEYTVTGENEHWTEITPHTENASCYFGKGSNWCTAPTGNNSSNQFNEYIKQGPTHILIPKAPRYEGEKYQVHAPTEQVTDETNTSTDISKIENHDASGQMLKPEHHRPFPSGNINNYKLALQTHIDARDPDPEVAMAAVNSQYANHGTVNYAALHQDPAVAMAALGHRLVSNQTTQNAAEHPYTAVGVAALNHGASNRYTSYRAISNRNPEVALAGLKHKDATFRTARYAAEHPDPKVAMAALNSDLNFLNFGNESQTVPDVAARHKSPEVAMAALAHSQADNNTTHIAAGHPDLRVAMAALAHSQVDAETTQTAAEHPDSAVALAALRHPLANEFTAGFAAKHRDPEVAMAALAHPKADYLATHNGARNSNSKVVLAALNHKSADEFTVRLASSHLTDSEIGMAALNHKHASTHSNSDLGAHEDPAVALGALNHRLADMVTTIQTVKNKNPAVALATLKHPLADKRTTHYGAEHRDPAVAMAALAHPEADVETTYFGAFHKNPEVALAAVNHQHADDHTLANASIHRDPAVVMAAINHPYANTQTLLNAADHKDSAVVMAALAHPKADALTTKRAAHHQDPKVALAALAHPSGTEGTANYGAQHPDPAVAMAALAHKYANSFTTMMAAEHQDPAVALAGLNHAQANATTFHAGQKHQDPEVRALATKKIFQSESYSPEKIKPFIRFLTEEDLTLEYHDTLNPKIWDGDELKPEVQAKLLQIAKKWATFAKIPDFAVTDIILVGGNANYNWTKFSDLDLHVVVNRKDLADCPDLLDDYLQNKKQLWALVHDITIYGHDVELYAQDKETPYPKKQGVYSIKGKTWIAKPKHEAVDFRGPVLLAKVKQYTERIDTLISTNAEDESFSKLKEKFKNMRSSGLKKIGEFSMENLVFKELRNRGVIDKMTKYLQSRLDQKLSLNENYPFQIQIHKKDGNKLVDVMQLNSETKTEAMGKGLRGLQDAKRNFKSKYPEAGDVADHQFSVRYPHDSSWITPTS